MPEKCINAAPSATASLSLVSARTPTTTVRRPTINDQPAYDFVTDVRPVSLYRRRSTSLRRHRRSFKTALFGANDLPPERGRLIKPHRPGLATTGQPLGRTLVRGHPPLHVFCVTTKHSRELGNRHVGQLGIIGRGSRVIKRHRSHPTTLSTHA